MPAEILPTISLILYQMAMWVRRNLLISNALKSHGCTETISPIMQFALFPGLPVVRLAVFKIIHFSSIKSKKM
jgi:hypothetical protein